MMKIEIPSGFILVESKGLVDEYPGVYISFSRDGNTPDEDIATVEYADGIIQTLTYCPDSDEPTHVIRASDGQEREN